MSRRMFERTVLSCLEPVSLRWQHFGRYFTQLQHATLHTLLSHAKDPVPSEQRNKIVYKYDCKDCEAVYFGESKRTIPQRTKEHTRAERDADNRRYETAADHCWKYNHGFDWEKQENNGL